MAHTENLTPAPGGGRAEAPDDRRPGVGGAVLLAPGTCVGRYTIVGLVGQGGMGQVYAASDPQLERTVALKLLHATVGGSSPVRRIRFLREAQAMARLVHPNVVSVFDVDTHGDQVFVAMELVKGETLSRWLARGPHDWRTIRDTFLAAGRGLLAAHDAGIVHRDFKPENVLVGAGRVVVADFGLARTAYDDDDVVGPADSPAASVLGLGVSATGALLGTPGYLAPEVLAGGSATTRSDQYSFCVALRDALGGQGPRFLAALVERGLGEDPLRRYPSMRELLRDLARDPGRTLRRGAGALAAAAILAAAGYAVALSRRAPPAAAACAPAAADARIASLWDNATRQRVRAAFLATGRPYVETLLASLELAIAARRTEWTAAYLDACRATHVHGEQSAAALDLRMGCLERARRQLQALVEDWQTGTNLDGALRGARSAGDIVACADPIALARPVPPPGNPEVRQRLETLRAEVDTVQALLRSGSYPSGLEKARAAVARARQLGYAPALAEALWLNGLLEAVSGTLATGIELLKEAARAAGAGHDEVLLARALEDLVYYLGARGGRIPEATALWTAAEAAVAQAGGRDDLRATLEYVEGAVLYADSRYRESAERLETAVRLQRRVHSPEHPDLRKALLALANAKKRLGQVDEALAIYEHDLAQTEKDFGPDHPEVASALLNIAMVRRARGETDVAAELALRALRVREKVDSPTHPGIASALYTLANIRAQQARFPEARALLERALAIQEQALGPDNAELAETLTTLAGVLGRQGDPAGARLRVERALAIQEKARGPEHPLVGITLQQLGVNLLSLGDVEAAHQAYARSLVIRRKSGEDRFLAGALLGLGDVALRAGRGVEASQRFKEAREVVQRLGETSGSYYVDALRGLGEAQIAMGQRQAALATLVEAVALEGSTTRAEVANARFQYARALWLEGERVRARAEAAAARAVLAEVDPPLVAGIDRWLAGRAR